MAGNFLLRAQEKVTKEKGTPGDSTCGSPRHCTVTTGRGHSASLLQVRSFVHPAQMTL